MLSYEEKLAVADSFPELERRNVSLGRVNYHYEQSAFDKKTVVYHLHPNGNGFVYAGHLPEYDTDSKGFVNIRDLTEEELHALIGKSIRSLAPSDTEAHPAAGQAREERWTNAKKQSLTVKFEDEDQMWYIYAGLSLDAAFETYEETREYLQEEGFTRLTSS